ncbi:MAG: hypothetical protein ACLU4J_08395 [Butyricimonas paravirosa]
MKIISTIFVGLALFLLSSCHEDETLTPRPLEMELRYEFPEGNNAWDQDLVEIADKFKTYLIYKNLQKKILIVLGLDLVEERSMVLL